MGRPKKRNTDSDKAPASDMEVIIGAIEQMGAKVLKNLDELAANKYLSTGMWGLDYIISHGGIPSIYIVEVHGPNGIGKTSLALHMTNQAKKAGMKTFFVDMEHAVNDAIAGIYVGKNDVNWVKPESGEKALDIIKMLLKTTQDSFIVLDSIGGCVPSKIADSDVGDSHIGIQARMFSQFGPTAAVWCKRNNNILFCLNQESTNISPMSKGGVVLPGGRRWSFVPDLRIRLTQKFQNGRIMDGDQSIGHIIEAKTTKNRHGPPMRMAELPLLYGYGFDTTRELLENAVGFGIVKKAGAWYSYEEERQQGMAGMSLWLSRNPEMEKKIRVQLDELVNEQ